MAAEVTAGDRVGDYDYDLPPELLAQYPTAERDGSRLLVLNRETQSLRHLRFPNLVELLDPGDLLVVNDSRVLRARLRGRKPTGAPAEILLVRPEAGNSGVDGGAIRWEAMVRPGAKLKPGRVVDIGPGLRVHVLESLPGGLRLVELETTLSLPEVLERFGSVPLPPYLNRDAEQEDELRYQTVYARWPGSVAAPTAGLHFTSENLSQMADRGIQRVAISLHIGPGTFRPVDVDDLTRHDMHNEVFDVPDETAAAIETTRSRGGRVWAVGTTVVRALESVTTDEGRIVPGAGSTDLFIRPPYRFRAVDALLTNFHLPRSTLLMLVAAFGGYDAVIAAYRSAIEHRYRFYSYGDAMAIIGNDPGEAARPHVSGDEPS